MASPFTLPVLLLLLTAWFTAFAPTPAIAVTPISENSECHSVPAQTALNFKKLRATWYVVQISEHLPAQSPPRAPVTKSACPQVDLWPPKSQSLNMRLSMQWREAGQGVQYDLRLPEAQHQGYWLADRPQNGSLAVEGKYRQFVGVVLVLKATNTHLVLTFCEAPGSGRHVYSVVLAREPQLNPEDLVSVDAMLEHRGLPLAGIQRTCKNYRNAAAAPAPSRVLGGILVFSVVLGCVVRGL